jgi:hypothetical protein
MNIGDLAKGVAAATGTNEADAKKAITAVFDQIANAGVGGVSSIGKNLRGRLAAMRCFPALQSSPSSSGQWR